MIRCILLHRAEGKYLALQNRATALAARGTSTMMKMLLKGKRAPINEMMATNAAMMAMNAMFSTGVTRSRNSFIDLL